MKAFLLMGQSNMAGRGNIEDVETIRDEKIKVFRMGSFIVDREPFGYDRRAAGIGLCGSFGLKFVEEYKEPVGFIPCAVGGTSLYDWRVGGDLFEYTYTISKLAQKQCEIIGILWHQGENNTGSHEEAENYEKDFMEIITEMKSRLGIENVPVILGELGQYLKEHPEKWFKCVDEVNQHIHNIAKQDGFYVVSAEGLTSNPDYIHFNAKSLRIFGERYFEVYKGTVAK